MKLLKKLQLGLLMSLIVSMMLSTTAFAQEAYTYTVTLYAGNQGVMTGKGIEIITSGNVNVATTDDKVVITGLQYNDRVNVMAQYAAEVSNEKYYVAGIRKSGRDNSEVEMSSYVVNGDKDYVVAYAIRGNMVAYTVNYQDEAGNKLLESNTFYGNVGESPVIAYRYVDGYLPQAYNLTKTLSENEQENVFTFVYSKLATGSTSAGGTDSESSGATEGTTTDSVQNTITIITRPEEDEAGTANAGNDADNDNQGVADGENEATGDDANGTEGSEGTESTDIQDEDTPLDLIDLEDEETPLASMEANDIERPGTKPNLVPVYAGIGIAAFLAVILSIVCLRKRKVTATTEESDE